MDSLIAEVIGEIALVLVISSVLSALARRCGQPGVIGQIVTGIVLGPTVLGHLPGHLTGRFFPSSSIPPLTVLSQVAVVIFMFVMGYELDLRVLRGHRRTPAVVAASALLVPMALGCGAVLADRSRFAALGRQPVNSNFVLFIGIAVSITALPVMTAIVREREIAGTTASTTATSAAALMDVAAWLSLAAVLAGASHRRGRPWPVTLLLFLCFIAGMRLVIRPLLRRWMDRRTSVLANKLPIALALALGSAWVTTSLDLHPAFGGFVAGLAMPGAGEAPDAEVLRPMEEVSNLFLPLFFVVTGLSLNIGFEGSSAMVLALVCVIAAAGKLGPAYAASRICGLGREDAAVVAALVNTRGLTELIALNLALSAGVIGQRLFSILVFMALVTTFCTAPLLTLINSRSAHGKAAERLLAAPPIDRH